MLQDKLKHNNIFKSLFEQKLIHIQQSQNESSPHHHSRIGAEKTLTGSHRPIPEQSIPMEAFLSLDGIKQRVSPAKEHLTSQFL